MRTLVHSFAVCARGSRINKTQNNEQRVVEEGVASKSGPLKFVSTFSAS